MPLYDYRCPSCGTEYHNIKKSIDERRSGAPKCCDGRAELVLKPTRHVMVRHFTPYACPVTEKPVTSERQRRNIMAKHDLVSHGDIKLRTVKEF